PPQPMDPTHGAHPPVGFVDRRSFRNARRGLLLPRRAQFQAIQHRTKGLLMKPANLLKHFGIALAILSASLLLFSFFPASLPAPEPMSPPTYLVATLLCLAVLLLLRRKQFWFYLPIPLLSLFAFLEEASYGVESGAVEALTWERHNVP